MLTVEAKPLAAALAHALKIVQGKCTVPVLTHVRIRCSSDPDWLELIATDLDLELVQPVYLPDGCRSPAMDFTVPAKGLAAVLKGVAKGGRVTFDYKTEPGAADNAGSDGQPGVMHLGGDADDLLPCYAGADLPEMQPVRLADGFSLHGSDFARLLQRVAHCISTEETRYYLNAVYLHTPRKNGEQPSLAAVTTDGHRLARQLVPTPDGAHDMPGLLIPTLAVNALLRMLPKADKATVRWALPGATRVEIRTASWALTSKLIDGTFPDYQRVIPTGNAKTLTLNVAELQTACEAATRAYSASDDRKRQRTVRLKLDAEGNALTTPLMQRKLAGRWGYKPMDIGFNADYLRAHCAAIEGADIVLQLEDAGAPVIVLDPTDADWTGVQMPMRI